MTRIVFPYDIKFCGDTIVACNQPLEQDDLQFPQANEIQTEACIGKAATTIANCRNTLATLELCPTQDFESYPDAFRAWEEATSKYWGGAEGELQALGRVFHAVLLNFTPVLTPLPHGVTRLTLKYEFRVGTLRAPQTV